MKPEPKFLKGTMCIGNPQGGGRDEEIFTIEIVDEQSRTQFIEIVVSPHDFAMAVKNRMVPVTFQLRAERVGYVSEIRTEVIEVPKCEYKEREQIMSAFLKTHPLAKEGWIGAVDDCTNHRRRTGDGKQSVLFRRWVHAETGEPYLP